MDKKEQIKKQIFETINNDPLLRDSIKKASLFGSYIHGKQNEKSDVDIVVEFKPNVQVGFFEFARIKRRINEGLEKKVDLLTSKSISKFFKNKVLKEAELIYG